ncbi:MAG: NAD(+)/NADH kinase [Polyangiaceae bacterium]|nr:NAD(+)/NADH kinase [Polyangiaceae bacterium]
MSAAGVPRIVIVTRPSDRDSLLARHGTREQARFFLERRGESMAEVDARHARLDAALAAVSRAIPLRWRRSRIDRADLCRFVFEPGDVIVAVGQDGLVANVAKYLSGQLVVGVNPDPGFHEGVLVPHRPERAAKLIEAAALGRCEVEARTMVEARLDDGQRVLALNEVFAGHRTHQSARYRLRSGAHAERHSSSGVIVSTGTGATGWARSIHRQRRSELVLPRPSDARLAFFVREAFPSVVTGADLVEGSLGEGDALEIVSEMNDGGVLFGDGIEEDRIDFAFGTRATVRVAEERLRLAH